MDEIDRAQIEVERQLDRALIYRKPEPKIKPAGYCHWCGEDVDGNKLFCDAACAKRHHNHTN